MAEEFVLMTHPDKPDRPVRARKVDSMKAKGWSVAETAAPTKTVPKGTTKKVSKDASKTPKENA